MARTTPILFLSLLLSMSSMFLALSSCGAGPPLPGSDKIQHVVVIFQENRTPDNLFHGLPNADIADSGLNSHGQTIPLMPQPLVNHYDLAHTHSAFTDMYDGGKMDGADKSTCVSTTACPSNPQFRYVNPSDVAPYFQLAEQYTFADRMFQTNQGPSFPAHQFIISGTSAPSVVSNLFAAENLKGGSIAGCIALAGTTVSLIDPSGSESLSQYPCFEHRTLTDLLDAKGIAWRYYAPSAGSIWTGPDAIQHVCQAQKQNGELVCTGPAWSHVIIPQTQVLTDISAGQLSAVSWVIPSGQASDHPAGNDGSGPSWVASIVNAIGNSSYWTSTAIFITWDDWGGWYDHVAPSVVNSYEYGFRVPLIVVSPYAKPAYVSRVTHDFGSLLKFIEEIYDLPSLGYADAPADDLSDCFNFMQRPLKFQPIATQHDAAYFLNDRSPALNPDDD